MILRPRFKDLGARQRNRLRVASEEVLADASTDQAPWRTESQVLTAWMKRVRSRTPAVLSSRPSPTEQRDGGGVERSRERVLCHADTRCSTQAASAVHCHYAQPGLHSLGQVMKCCSGDSYSVEFPESATCSTDPWDLSTPPHALRLFVVGRDDRSF